jgi:hypothetical protein
VLTHPFEFNLAWLLAGLAVASVAAWFGWIEYQAYLLKTHVEQAGGVLRFVAHGWSVEAQRSTNQLLMQSRHAHYSRQPLGGGAAQVQEGQVTAKIPAPGLRIDIQPSHSAGKCLVEFHASDELTLAAQGKTGGECAVVRLDGIPEPVAASFGQFASQLRLWVEKLEKRLAIQREAEAAEKAAQEAALAEAAAAATGETSKEILTPDVQVAKWRKTAGFAGTSSEIGLNDKGGILWYVDLDPTGRITLHANNRTIHTTLAGAAIVSLGGELEVGVRDDYWSEEEPELRTLRILKGLPPDERRAWKERMEILRDNLRQAAGIPAQTGR